MRETDVQEIAAKEDTSMPMIIIKDKHSKMDPLGNLIGMKFWCEFLSALCKVFI